jgi:hypothetical protein
VSSEIVTATYRVESGKHLVMLPFSPDESLWTVLRANSENYSVESGKQQEMLPFSPNATLKGQYCE